MTDRIVFANDIPYDDGHLDPMRSIGDALAFAADDWGASRAMAWIYGIVLGWGDDDDLDDPDPDNAMDGLAARFGWSDTQVTRLRALHAEWKRREAKA